MADQVPSPPPGVTPGDHVPWRWTDALLVMVLIIVLVNVAVGILSQVLAPDLTRGAILPVGAALMALSTYGFVRWRYRGQAPRLFGDGPHRWVADVLLGLGLSVAAYVILNLLLRVLLLGRQAPEVQQQFQELALDPALAPLVLLGAVVLAPLAEELFFRGLLFQALHRRLGLWPGIGLSSVVFALAHRQATLEGTLLLFVAFFPLGMFLAWLFARRRSLVAPVLCHAGWNAINYGVLLLTDRYGL